MFNEYGWFEGSLSDACVEDCSAQGDVSESVKFWVKHLDFSVPRDLAVPYLREYGAWDDLDYADDDTLAQRVLWLAACDIHEGGEWFGLVH